MKEVKPFPNSKMIKILKCDNLLPPPRHSHKKPLQDDDDFFAKMTLVHARSFALRKSRPRRLSKRQCTRGKWFAHQSYYIKKDHQWCAPKIPLHKSTPQVLLFLTKTNINSWYWKQTKFHGGGRSWPGLVTQERILKNSTDTEGAVDSVRINTKIHLKLRMDSFAYLPIAVPFTHWNFLFFLVLKTIKNSSGQMRQL